MKILALDTSTEYLSVALWQDGQLIQRDCHAGQKHSDLTLPMVRDVLNDAGLSLADLDGIAFGHGPGSFTGLRIGCGIVQGLAFAHQLPVVGVCTLLALAESSAADQVAACLDARMNQVYFAAYRRAGGGWEAVVEAGLFDPDAVPELPGTGWTGLGSGYAAHGTALQAALGAGLQVADSSAYPHASAIARFGARELSAGRGKPAHEANLLYLRDKVALTAKEQPRSGFNLDNKPAGRTGTT